MQDLLGGLGAEVGELLDGTVRSGEPGLDFGDLGSDPFDLRVPRVGDVSDADWTIRMATAKQNEEFDEALDVLGNIYKIAAEKARAARGTAA
ncbi:hypothetical protein [Streptomyces sp. NPDC005244]|uniref:hypothetical protein n=1 Tax=Streptomyces sp. NPDC005244 TaxID=3364708 RepID=UPI00367DDA7E